MDKLAVSRHERLWVSRADTLLIKGVTGLPAARRERVQTCHRAPRCQEALMLRAARPPTALGPARGPRSVTDFLHQLLIRSIQASILQQMQCDVVMMSTGSIYVPTKGHPRDQVGDTRR